MRLDQYLVHNKLAKSRNEAIKLIANNFVYVNNQLVNKNNLKITDQLVNVIAQLKYVSRAGFKLKHALEKFKINISNSVVLDLGSSTGGFADVCLQNGTELIYCVDVGHDQLDNKIKNNPKVINLEKTNIKDLDTTLIRHEIDLVVSDLSFISSKHMFNSIMKLKLKKGCNIISLIKPQFELNKQIIDRFNAKITDTKYHQMAINNVRAYALENNLKVMQIIDSPITGAKKQNQEFLIWCKYE